MNNVFVAALLFDLCSACTRSNPEAASAAQFSTIPPPSDCDFVGSASASATEPSPLIANRTARERLGAKAERLGGNYVEVTTQDTRAVDFQLEASMARLEGRFYKCPPNDGDGGTAAALAAGSSDQVDADAGNRPELACRPPAEPRPLDPAEARGWQCARKTTAGWVADGAYVDRWESGSTKTEGAFVNGKRSGAWSSYYANGQVRERATFRDGLLEGCAQEFDADGHALPPLCSGAPAVDASDTR